jgi:tRNA(fMet)-specific endonuclease VapC
VSRLLLDTTFLVDADRREKQLDAAVADDDDGVIAAVTVAELLVGVELSTARSRSRRREFLEAVIATVPVVSYDLAVAEAHAQLLVTVRRQGRPRGAHDLIIAATARATRRAVVTADTGAFSDLPEVAVRTDV